MNAIQIHVRMAVTVLMKCMVLAAFVLLVCHISPVTREHIDIIHCRLGYTSATCNDDVNECESNPCQHGGSCFDDVNQFTCSCVAGYTGSTCGTEINECASNPCQNGAQCVDFLNRYECLCEPGHTGNY